MTVEIARSRKRFPTLRARIWLVTSMSSCVPRQNPSLSEATAAFLAHIWLVPSVSSYVLRQSPSLSEATAAFLAHMRPFTGVRQRVLGEVRRMIRLVFTLAALVPLRIMPAARTHSSLCSRFPLRSCWTGRLCQ